MLNKDLLVEILEELAVLMDLNGQNSFKVRAVQNGARILDKSAINVEQAVADGSIESIQGIGKGMQSLIREFVSTGSIREYIELKATVPAGVLSLTKLRGVGAKKALQLHQTLGINSIGELEYACRENRLAELKGFGEKTQTAILNAISVYQSAQGKCLQRTADRIAADLIEECTALGVQRAEISGGLRRRCEVLEEVSIVCQGANADELASHFHSQVQNGCLTFTRDGMTVKLFIAGEAEFERILFQSSASVPFLDAFTTRFSIGATAKETEIFSSNQLQWIEPELREDPAILERALTNSIPDLIAATQMRGMLHIHSTWSDGSNSIREMALQSRDLGFSYVAMCDHSKTAAYANGLSVERVEQQHEEIDRLNDENLGIRILKGIESDILSDGSLDYDDEILDSFDCVVASVHSAFQLSAAQQTTRIINAILNPYTTIVGHPTGRLLLARNGYDLDIDAILQAAAETGTVIELNANPHRFDLDWRWHQRAVERGVRIAINPDSHQTSSLQEVFLGVGIARKGMLRSSDVLNTLNLEEFLTFCSSLRKSKHDLLR